MRDENKSDYVRRLSALAKNNMQAETALGFALLQSGSVLVSPENVNAYEDFEKQKECLAKKIQAIGDISAFQKEIQAQLAELKKTQKEHDSAQAAAYEQLGQALYEGYTENLAEFFSGYHEEIAFLQTKIQMADDSDEDGEDKNVFGRIASALRSSSKSLGVRQMENQLARLYRKAGDAAFASEGLAKLAKTDSLNTGIMRVYEECRKLEDAGTAITRQEKTLAGQFEGNIQTLKDQGVTGVDLGQSVLTGGIRVFAAIVPARLKELNRLIAGTAAQEEDLAAQTGQTYADSVLSSDGTELQSAAEELVPLVQTIAEIRRDAALCKIQLEIFNLTVQIDTAAKLMRQSTERLGENIKRIKKLTEENTGLEGKITGATEEHKKCSAQRVELLKRCGELNSTLTQPSK
ncbi:MAG: hypothetical protein LBS97_07165 [Treponema sp.]|jgi:hypothetical protein|nr:hypothetical protein [Treponema sp.]